MHGTCLKYPEEKRPRLGIEETFTWAEEKNNSGKARQRAFDILAATQTTGKLTARYATGAAGHVAATARNYLHAKYAAVNALIAFHNNEQEKRWQESLYEKILEIRL